MWWFVKKQYENETNISYAYGFETKKVSGVVEYDKLLHKFTLNKIADNDNKKLVERFLYRHLFKLINDENCPDERQIAIG